MSEAKREGFTFYKSYIESCKDFAKNETEENQFIRKIIDYAIYNIEPKFDNKILKGAFNLIKPNIDSSIKKYDQRRNARQCKMEKKCSEQIQNNFRTDSEQFQRVYTNTNTNNNTNTNTNNSNVRGTYEGKTYRNRKRPFIDLPKYDDSKNIPISEEESRELSILMGKGKTNNETIEC